MTWNTNSLWVEAAVVSVFFLPGNIFLAHFEERSPDYRRHGSQQ